MGAHPHRQTAASRSRGRLTATLALTCAFLVVEVAGALWSGSLALLADAGHMLADTGGLGLALFAIWIAGRPPTPAKTYGYYRAPTAVSWRRPRSSAARCSASAPSGSW